MAAPHRPRVARLAAPRAAPQAQSLFTALAPYASLPQRSRGRRMAEVVASDRNAFQRDRDRIVHSTAFRRLVYKTQVFLNHEGDLFRTRLTHSLEVAQLARSMARGLGLHEDLVEALALAHDLGHTPFGHAGQDALNACMQPYGGFEHNLQSLRVVDVLEQRYPQFDGLNLSFETREGILKHCSMRVARHMESLEPAGVAHRFIAGYQASLEAQLCNLADEIAYNAHDVDDGVRSGLISLEQLMGLTLVRHFHDEAVREYPSLPGMGRRRLLSEVLRRMLSAQVHDLLRTTKARVARAGAADAWQARQGPALVGFSPSMRAAITELKRFLLRALYRHEQVLVQTQRGKTVVHELFTVYAQRPAEMPPEYAQRADTHRAVADYVAGMTDRFAMREHERLTGRRLFA